RDHQRIDLGFARITIFPEVEQRREHSRYIGSDLAVDARIVDRAACLIVMHAEGGIDAFACDGFGILRGDFLDLDATLGGNHRNRPSRTAVHRHAHVEFVDEIDGGFDEHALDGIAFEVHSENGIGGFAGFVFVFGEFDPAGLAAPADVDLCLYGYRITDRFGGGDHVFGVFGESGVGYRHPGLGEDLLCLIFVQSHR